MQQMGLTPGQVLPGQVPAVVSHPSYAPSYYRSFERSDLHTNVGIQYARNTQLSVLLATLYFYYYYISVLIIKTRRLKRIEFKLCLLNVSLTG